MECATAALQDKGNGGLAPSEEDKRRAGESKVMYAAKCDHLLKTETVP